MRMEDSKSCTTTDDDDDDVDSGHFFDALDEFPAHDSDSTTEPDESISISSFESFDSDAKISLDLNPFPEAPFPSNIRSDVQESPGDESKGSNLSSMESRDTTSATNRSPGERKLEFSRNLKEAESENEELYSFKDKFSSEEANNYKESEENSTSMILNERNDKSAAVDLLSGGERDEPSSSFLLFLAGIMIKAIAIQLNLLISVIVFPVKLICCSYMFVIDPFGAVRRCRNCLVRKILRIWGFVYVAVVGFLCKWFKEQKSVWKTALKIGWGLLWSCYVCVVLVILLLMAFVMGGLVMWCLLEKPIHMSDMLNFDYTQDKPIAFVSIIACPDLSCGMDCREKVEAVEFFMARIISPKKKLQVTVSLTLPESDYNRNIGIFLVRVDFLSADGKAFATLRHPCMLQFKSHPIRLLLTFLKIGPLVLGYTSETQNLIIKFKGFTEGDTPTACLRVSIEQRAEFRPSSGIPEIYSASLSLRSELPILKQILWRWKTTVFIWISITVFVIELLFGLLCCKPIIIPRVRLRDGSSNNNTLRRNHPVQR